MSLGKVRSNADGLAVCSDRLVDLALVVQRIAEVRISFGEVGFDADRLPICGDRLLELALVVQHHTKVGKINWMSNPFYSVTDQLDGLVIATHLLSEET